MTKKDGDEYEHHKEMEKLDALAKTLANLQDKFVKQNVQCHLLQVDLATQMSPYLVQSLNDVKESCADCKDKVNKCQMQGQAKESVPPQQENTASD